MKLVLITIGIFVAILYVAAILTWWFDHPVGDFILRCLTPLSIFGAVIAALFVDYLREKIFPIEIKIVIPDESNTVIDENSLGRVYVHHLFVKNLTPHRAIINCRVWLKRIEVQQIDNAWMEEQKFAVPHLMEWAPSEYLHDKRTFIKQQVFDLGRTRENNGEFLLAFKRDLGGAVPRAFPTGKKLRFTFFVSADNYLDEKEFCFEVDVLPAVQGYAATPAKVTAVLTSS